jgi:surface polysaccharide O-acyltransferase-like enzyme
MENNSNRNLWIDYLRSALTILVVAHHSSLAYTTFAKFDKVAYINSTHPIVDIKRWIGLDIFENYNDIFFMSLMFLIGGLFLSKSINKKGIFTFIWDRVYRLFIPFLLGGTLLMLIAYFPSYYVAHESTDIIAYIKDFFIIEKWPVGPPWFIWVLFLFNLLFAFSYSHLHKLYEKPGNNFHRIQNKPILLFGLMVGVTWILYVPIAYKIGAGTWIGIGPFDFQVSRILLYFGYFTLGSLIGNTNFNSDLFSTKSPIVKKWWLWLLLSLSVYFLLTIIVGPLTQMVKDGNIKEFIAWMIYYTIYSVSCTLSCIAFITTFRKLINSQKLWWNSLSENAYIIYLIHFIFITWIQFSLLSFNIPAFFKFLLTFIISLIFSWGTSILLRKFKIIHKYL